MEIGSFIELQLPKGREYYKGNIDIARLNTGRVAIWHSLRCTGCSRIWVPYYQCNTVRDFLKTKNVDILYYNIDKNFNPINIKTRDNDAVLIVNYYGVMSHSRIESLSKQYKHPIIDNCQAFFCQPVYGAMNVYSARKFLGVADGAYVIGNNADKFVSMYPQCYSSDTASFLLKRIEYGCEGKSYEERSINERRVDSEDAMKMSKLTYAILDGIDYGEIMDKRRDNFLIASKMFKQINLIDPTVYYDGETIPMVYPLVVEDDSIMQRLITAKHFQGHWWSYILDEIKLDCFETWLSRNIIPITIDQRYGCEHLEYIRRVIYNDNE